MFGGLHIEKLLPEIHRQLIAGSRLPQFPDQAKVSITGARLDGEKHLKLPRSVTGK